MESQNNFSDEILERFQKIVTNKKTSRSPKVLSLTREITRQISSGGGGGTGGGGHDEETIHELNERIQQLNEKLFRRDETILNLRREAALAMLQTIDQTRIDGGITSILTRIFNNIEQMNQYENELIQIKNENKNYCHEIFHLKKNIQINEKKYFTRFNSLETQNYELLEKCKQLNNENKQKTIFLNGKDNLLEQQQMLLCQRDEKYSELEEKYSTLMVRISSQFLIFLLFIFF